MQIYVNILESFKAYIRFHVYIPLDLYIRKQYVSGFEMLRDCDTWRYVY